MLQEATADIELKIEALTNTNKKVIIEYEVNDIPCVVHHYCDIPDEMSDREMERCYMEAEEWFEDNMTLADITDYAIEYDLIGEDEEIVSWTFTS